MSNFNLVKNSCLKSVIRQKEFLETVNVNDVVAFVVDILM